MKNLFLAFPLLLVILCSCGPKGSTYDTIIRNGTVYDGSGKNGVKADVAILNDTIAAIGDLSGDSGVEEVDATGMAVSPGFINMLSWATESLIEDGRALADLRQGVTLEVMGEGWSMGPLNEEMREQSLADQADIKYDIPWTTLSEYLQFLEDKGVAVNVASYVGATTLRIHEIGFEDRPPTDEELLKMKALARQAMEEGAVGLGSSLIYAPAFYAGTEELIELCKVISDYGGTYVTHMRSEGNRLLQAIDEVLRIANEADVKAEIYHLKAAGKSNWPKMDQVITKLDSAQKAGIDVATNMYNYVAGATGLDASMPPWVQEGGYDEWAKRLRDPSIRKRVIEEMKTDAEDWENLYFASGSPEKLLLVGFKNDSLKKYTGKSLAEVAKIHGKSAEETALDMVIADGSRVGTVYFLMSEENVKKQIRLPYMTFGSDAGAPAPEGVFLKSNPHPRAYGNFARLLGKYVREENVISLHEAIHKLTGMAADRLKIRNRGYLKKGHFADVVVFDPKTISDHATFEEPHQLATGVRDVWVNGKQVLKDSESTGEFSGRHVRGPGYKGE